VLNQLFETFSFSKIFFQQSALTEEEKIPKCLPMGTERTRVFLLVRAKEVVRQSFITSV